MGPFGRTITRAVAIVKERSSSISGGGEPGYLRTIVFRRLILVPAAAVFIAVAGLQLTAPFGGLPWESPGRSPDPAALAPPVPTPGPAAVSPPPASTPIPTTSARPSVPPRTGPTANARISDRLQERLEATRRELGIPGIQATVLYPDGTAWTGTSGQADIAAGVPVAPETPFAVASISKSFTAAVILQLVGSGELDLDESVAPHLPALGLDKRITVRQLLDHTSGLNDYLVRSNVDRALRADLGATWTAAKSFGFVGKPYFLPGRGWHYSNTNYLVLGLLAESVTGIPLSRSIRERVFEPLGLTTASYQGAEEPRGAVARAYRFAVGPPGGAATEWRDGSAIVPFTAVVTATAGAGSIAASSLDVARFARAMWGGEELVPRWVLDEAIADALTVGARRGALPYGLGVQAYAVDGRAALGHSGRFSGARAVVRYLTDEGIAIAVLTNQSRVDPAIVLSRLLAIAAPVHRAAPGASAQ